MILPTFLFYLSDFSMLVVGSPQTWNTVTSESEVLYKSKSAVLFARTLPEANVAAIINANLVFMTISFISYCYI